MTQRRLNGNHQSDPKATCRVRLQIGTVSGIKLECLSGFASEYPSGFIGIRTDITFRRIAGENFRRGRVQRHYSALSELGLPDRQNTGIEIHIVSLKQEGLRKTQTGLCDQTEEAVERSTSQTLRMQDEHRREKVGNLVVRIDIGTRSTLRRENPGWWNFRPWLDHRDVARKGTDR